MQARFGTGKLDGMIGGAARLLIAPNATHMDFYDRLEYIDPAVEETVSFFRERLPQVNVSVSSDRGG